MKKTKPLPKYKWRWISGFENLYKISSRGRVKSVARKIKRSNERIISIPEKILQSTKSKYPIVCLRKNKKSYWRYVHSLVLETFRGPCPQGMEACHRNDDKSDNRLSNLYWGTHSSNMKDAYQNEVKLPTRRLGEDNSSTTLTEKKIRQIRKLHSKNPSRGILLKLSRQFDVTPVTIGNIITRKTWGHI